MMLPDFLKKENRKQLNELDQRFYEAVNRYNEYFKDDGLITEGSSLSREEWIDYIDTCLRENITIWELFGENYDEELDYWKFIKYFTYFIYRISLKSLQERRMIRMENVQIKFSTKKSKEVQLMYCAA